MERFYLAFGDEIVKLAAAPAAKSTAWAMARGLTSGLAAGLMGASMMSLANKGRKQEHKSSVLAPALSAAAVGTSAGLIKGFTEKGLERTFLKMLSKGK